jgi:hypothetical protein
MGPHEVTLEEILTYPEACEAFKTIENLCAENKGEIGALLVAIANEPLHRYRYRPIPASKVRNLAGRLRTDADIVLRVTIQNFAALSAKREEYQKLPELLNSFASEIAKIRPAPSSRPAEHRRLFEFRLLGLITGGDPERPPHFAEAAALLNAAYATAETKQPKAIKKLFGRKSPTVDPDSLGNAYRRFQKRSAIL